MRKKHAGYKATGVSPHLGNVASYTVAPLSETEWEPNSCPEEEWGNPLPAPSLLFLAPSPSLSTLAFEPAVQVKRVGADGVCST